MINLSLLSDIGMSLLAFLVYGGAIALACYLIMKLLSKPLVSMISRVTLIQEKKSILRPVPEDVRAIISKGVRNEAELTYLLKSLAQENGWKSEDVAKIPTWLLTGHIIMDANPNLPYEFSKRDSGYRETDMN